jgi:hypothetical protein
MDEEESAAAQKFRLLVFLHEEILFDLRRLKKGRMRMRERITNSSREWSKAERRAERRVAGGTSCAASSASSSRESSN